MKELKLSDLKVGDSVWIVDRSVPLYWKDYPFKVIHIVTYEFNTSITLENDSMRCMIVVPTKRIDVSTLFMRNDESCSFDVMTMLGIK